ncbi:hypothetical protein [Streptomyces sp. NPDC101237]|uniref:hypothetical protein n=1 Tax=Streptomyces sp. NPDC101237 TaxID=3366139 RepID=UPI00380AB581
MITGLAFTAVPLFPEAGTGTASASATPSLPAKGRYCDSSPRVTYGQQDRGDALDR